ncbi:MAG: type II toxin-antitoxin system VapC family toxin [Candidatus Nanopelagicales bacterium]|nr:type II toxin-antitoxin system VapC family toxin [Candidatus Nanopelagicales bacterium]MCF8539921.1 type II toxin-antitoxin system VapC family toxin [Candidatus Nanopelagicales bacterium]MCF8551764.1 type II toxin-antitoxin system VapC family toxin [Candidatus Nanopelagicales bacterium]
MSTRTPIGLLDTSVVIALSTLSEQDLPTISTISSITLAELSVGPLVTTDIRERQRRQLVLQTAETTFDPLPFDSACARRFGVIASELRASGRTSRARGLDALIAATALTHELPLFTRNVRDFAGITGLDVRAV